MQRVNQIMDQEQRLAVVKIKHEEDGQNKRKSFKTVERNGNKT